MGKGMGLGVGIGKAKEKEERGRRMSKISIELTREEWYQVIDILDRHASTHEEDKRAEKLFKKIHEAIPFMADEDMPF